jgi:hypothetical protein
MLGLVAHFTPCYQLFSLSKSILALEVFRALAVEEYEVGVKMREIFNQFS